MTRFLMVVVTAALSAGCALAGVTLGVQYDFEAGDRSLSRVTARIDGVEMGKDVPLAVTGEAGVDLTLEVLEVSEEGVATIRATFGEVEATLMDDPQDAGTPEPAELAVDERGALVELTAGDGAALDLFASGGVPLQFVVLLAGVVEMPSEPVGPGEEWTIERCQQLPDVGEVSMTVTSRITEISEGEIVVVTDINATVPEFSTANPLRDGAEATVQDGVLTIEGMTRRIDMTTGLIKAADADMRFDGFTAIGAFPPLPLGVDSSFEIRPMGEENDR
ncbi:MAG: hypothetical protein ACLFU7_02355 [Armatimonadota bacterium]